MLQVQAFIVAIILLGVQAETVAKDNGDVYMVNGATTASAVEPVDFPELMKVCNASFSIPMSYVEEFRNTGQLSDTTDKTGMCYLRCMWEKSGLINNWNLNADKIRTYIWPATGDTLDVCAKEGMNEQNDCVRTYMIASCLMMRSIVDARNKPTV